MKRLGNWPIPVMVFAVVFAAYLLSPVTASLDSAWHVHTAASIIRQGNTDLDEYRQIIVPGDYRIREIDDHLYNKFPLGVALAAVPVVFVVDVWWTYVRRMDFSDFIKHSMPVRVEASAASFLVALTALLVYLLGQLLLQNRAQSLVLAAVFAFCTSAWSVASRALWTRGPSMLVLTAALNLILASRTKPALIQFASIPLVLSYSMDPCDAISAVLLTLYVLVERKRYLLAYALWAMCAAVPLLWFNLSVYHTPLFYYMLTPFQPNNCPLNALAANLVSPSRGLFVFSPVLAFAVYGAALKVKRREWISLDYFLLGIIALHFTVASSYSVWWSGHSFGPRFLMNVIPYFVYFLAPVLRNIAESRGMQRMILASVFAACAAVSFFIRFRGATSPETWAWNSTPVGIDAAPARVWDWRDPQFLRGALAETPQAACAQSRGMPSGRGSQRLLEEGRCRSSKNPSPEEGEP